MTVVRHKDLVDTVRDVTGLEETDTARAATAGVISSVAHSLPADARTWLADELPGTIEDAARIPGQDSCAAAPRS
jgi:uncharacterized protein (DUF2267 family)